MDLFSVVVTGANRGIGLEFVRQLAYSAKSPNHIFATYRNKESTKELEEISRSSSPGVELHLVRLDVREKEDIENLKKVVEDVVGNKGLTLLINNAGIAREAHIPDVSLENLDILFRVNAAGPILVTQELLPLLKMAASLREGPGMSASRAAILNISSLLGSISRPLTEEREKRLMSYKISKASLNMGMRVLAAVVKEDNILVVTMFPGIVKTSFGPASVNSELLPQDSIAAMLETLSKLNETHHSTFMNRFGKLYGW